MNKYSISYNVFDGVELLEDSITNIREYVDHISLIFQTTSYWGEKLSKEEINIVNSLKENNLIDDIIHFDKEINITNANQSGSVQIYKRNLGKEIAKQKGCTHYMTMDCDEFYTKEEFEKLINYHNENPQKISYIPLEAYYKDTVYMIDSSKYMDGDLFVSGFFPVKYNLVLGYPLPFKVDPTRKPNVNNVDIFKMWKKDEMKMHHLSYIRANIYKKVNNANAKWRYKDNQLHFKKLQDCYDSYEQNKVALSADDEEYSIIFLDKPEITLDKYYENVKYINGK